MNLDPSNDPPPPRHPLAVPLGLALVKVLIHLPVLQRYGYHHDELYFIACGAHLSFDLGLAAGLPRAASFAKTCRMRADTRRPIDTDVAVGRSVELAEVKRWDTPLVLASCRRPRLSMEALWP